MSDGTTNKEQVFSILVNLRQLPTPVYLQPIGAQGRDGAIVPYDLLTEIQGNDLTGLVMNTPATITWLVERAEWPSMPADTIVGVFTMSYLKQRYNVRLLG